MADQHETTVRDALIAVHTIMPTLLDIIARQNPKQREEIETALTYAIDLCGAQPPTAEMSGVARILANWQSLLTPPPARKLNS